MVGGGSIGRAVVLERIWHTHDFVTRFRQAVNQDSVLATNRLTNGTLGNMYCGGPPSVAVLCLCTTGVRPASGT